MMNETNDMPNVGIPYAQKLLRAYFTTDDLVMLDLLPHSEIPTTVRLNMCMLVACVQGEMHISINEHDLTVGKNQLLICGPQDVIGRCHSSDDIRGKILCINATVLQDSMNNSLDLVEALYHLKKQPVVSLTEEEARLFNLYGELIDVRSRLIDRAFGTEVIYTLIRTAYYEVLACLSHVAALGDDRRGTQQEVLFKRFIQLLVTQKVKPRSVTWYSERLCVTPKYLSAACKMASKRTAFSWINECVMADIRYQLKCTDRSIKEIADYLDFPNISFFGKFVRHHAGCSPTVFRQRLRKQMPL